MHRDDLTEPRGKTITQLNMASSFFSPESKRFLEETHAKSVFVYFSERKWSKMGNTVSQDCIEYRTSIACIGPNPSPILILSPQRR